MAAIFNDIWAEHRAWSRDFSFLLRLFSQWLKENGLMDSGIAARIASMEHRVRFEKVTIAFVAECSRGNSELINALFFADHVRPILPATAGRATICPMEIGYEPGTSVCLRLLPIQTRRHPQSLSDWRAVPEAWVRSDLDVTNTEQLASALERVTETLQVGADEGQALGFFQTQGSTASAELDSEDLVEIPKWRYALVNIPHPLLERGLMILDMPGLNAMCSEPQLTQELIAQAHAVVFVLGADTALTRSDLAICERHFAQSAYGAPTPMVVLNQLDALRSTSSVPDQMQEQAARQIANVGQKLTLEPRQILAVTAKGALIPNPNKNAELPAESCINELQAALVHRIFGQGKQLKSAEVHGELTQIHLDLDRAIQIRKSGIAERLTDLHDTQRQSAAVLSQLRRKLASDRRQFELCYTRFSALIAVQSRLFETLLSTFDEQFLRQEVQTLYAVLAQPGLKLGAKNAYAATFERLHLRMSAVQSQIEEIQAMHAATFDQLNTQFKFSLGAVTPPTLEPHRSELNLAQLHHAKDLGLQNAFRLQQTWFVERLSNELFVRLARLREGVLADLMGWRNSLAKEIDAQLGPRRVTLEHRRETVEKIEQVASGIEQRTNQLSMCQQDVERLSQKLYEQVACLIATNDDGRKLDASVLAEGPLQV